jgi:hypothetical protein
MNPDVFITIVFVGIVAFVLLLGIFVARRSVRR